MTSRFLFLSLVSVVLAVPPPVRQQDSINLECTNGNPICTRTVFLKDGVARISINSFFNLEGTDPRKAELLPHEIVDGADDNIITLVDFDPPTLPGPGNFNVLYTATVTFRGFPGRASLRISIKDNKGKIHRRTHIFEIVGIVLYELRGDEPNILTGLNPNKTVVEALDGGTFGTTVNVALFAGNPTTIPVDPQEIRLRIAPEFADILPWSREECPISADKSSLGSRCAMAFTPDFKTFSIRTPPGMDIPFEIPVEFEWVGIREYQQRANGEFGVTVSAEETANSFTDDVITSAIIARTTNSQNSNASPSTSLAGWKIGVIAIIGVLLVIAAITFVCCCCCGRKRSPKKPEPDVVGFKDKFQEIGFLRRSTLRRSRDDLDDDDQCYVEEPPTPDGSEILMLENESRGHRRSAEGHVEGLIPMDPRLNEDKSVERLVLPPGVVRGVELESSTEGASAFDYGTRCGGNDDSSYDRVASSGQRDRFTKTGDNRSSRDRSSMASRRSEMERSRDPDYFRDSHERMQSYERDRARIRELDRELERERSARERSRPRSSEEEFPESGPVVGDRTNGMMSRSRGGVGAAIDRIRQLDLLSGPASRGLVGRNGEPIHDATGETRSGKGIVDISGSTLS